MWRVKPDESRNTGMKNVIYIEILWYPVLDVTRLLLGHQLLRWLSGVCSMVAKVSDSVLINSFSDVWCGCQVAFTVVQVATMALVLGCQVVGCLMAMCRRPPSDDCSITGVSSVTSELNMCWFSFFCSPNFICLTTKTMHVTEWTNWKPRGLGLKGNYTLILSKKSSLHVFCWKNHLT